MFKVNPERENKNEAKPPPGDPSKPPWLDEYGDEAWGYFSELLRGMRVLTVADEAALCQLCMAYSNWRQAAEKVVQFGQVTVRDGAKGKLIERNRYDLVARDWFDRFKQMLIEFGLTPSSRSRLEVPKFSEDADVKAKFFKAG